MPESNKKTEGTVSMTPTEYINAILETGTSLDVIEDFVVRKIADINAEIKALPAEEKEQIKQKEADVKKFEKILQEIKKQILKESAEQKLKENIEKTKQCYKETLSLGKEVVKYIESITIDEYFDTSSALRNLSEKNKKFKDQLSIQLELTKKNVDYLNLLKEDNPELNVIEKYEAMIPSFEGETRDYVKEKYKETRLKIKELEENDKDKNKDLINELYNTINDVLPYMLTNPKEMEKIKEEVGKEIGKPYKPSPVGGDTGGSDDGGNETPPITEQDDPKFAAAKNEYLSTIGYINELVEELEMVNDEQDIYAANPEFNCHRIIDLERRAFQINNRIMEYKNKLSDIEYDNYIKHHILLNLDPDIAAAEIKVPRYSSVLDEFMAIHNNVIEIAYRNLFILEKTKKAGETLDQDYESLNELIDSQHLVINRRLIAERQQDKSFDIIGYMRAHKVDIKKIKEEVDQIDFTEQFDDDPELIAKFEKDLTEFKQDLSVLVGVKYLLQIKIDRPEILAQEEFDNEINELIQGNIDAINESSLSEETKQQLVQRVIDIQTEVLESLKAYYEVDGVYHQLRVDFKEDFMAMMKISDELIELSKVSMSSEEYLAKKEILNAKAEEMISKYQELGIKLTRNPSTQKISLTIFNNAEQTETIKYSLSVMTLEHEKALSRKVSIKVKPTNLDFNSKVQDINRQKALIETTDAIKISLLKDSIKVQYTKEMLENLKSLKVKLEIAASAENKAPIAVTQGKESKDGTKEYRYIKQPDDLSEAKLVYRDIETGEEIMSTDILADENIRKAIEERKTISR